MKHRRDTTIATEADRMIEGKVEAREMMTVAIAVRVMIAIEMTIGPAAVLGPETETHGEMIKTRTASMSMRKSQTSLKSKATVSAVYK